jgi:hypothetical protein
LLLVSAGIRTREKLLCCGLRWRDDGLVCCGRGRWSKRHAAGVADPLSGAGLKTTGSEEEELIRGCRFRWGAGWRDGVVRSARCRRLVVALSF